MLLVELIASSVLDPISKQARPEYRCKLVLVTSVTHPWQFFLSKFIFGRLKTNSTHPQSCHILQTIPTPTSIFAHLWQVTLTLSKFTNPAASIKIDHQKAGVNSPTPDSELSREQVSVLNRVTGVSMFLVSTVTCVIHPRKLFREPA